MEAGAGAGEGPESSALEAKAGLATIEEGDELEAMEQAGLASSC